MKMKLSMNSLSHFVQEIKETERYQWEEFFLFLIQFHSCNKCHEVNFKRGGSYIH